MKIYFDSLEPNQGNLANLLSDKWWSISDGTVMKRELNELEIGYETLDNLDMPGVYYVDVNGDPNWWSGQAKGNTPKHIIYDLPQHILDLIRQKKLRLIIKADKEGGPMENSDIDAFGATSNAMIDKQLPAGSVLVMQGNSKIQKQYEDWLLKNNRERMFEVMYCNHFAKIFFDNKMPDKPCIYNALMNLESKSYNSLNRVYRPHRAAHIYNLKTNNLLDKGIVSFNTNATDHYEAADLVNVNKHQLAKELDSVFPIYIDGDWKNENAAWNYNTEIYDNSYLTVITETIFKDNTSFVTEKIFKPIALGHPFLLIAGSGTLQTLQEMGFRCDFLGIGTEYDRIENPRDRFIEIHRILKSWVELDIDEKRRRIGDSMEAIMHNYNLVRRRNYHHEAIIKSLESSAEYFNETI